MAEAARAWAGEPRRLVPAPWRPLAVVAWLAACLALAVLAWHLHQTGTGGRLDTRLDPGVAARLAGHRRALHDLARVGSPAFVAAGSALLALACVARRWWRGAVFAAAAAPLAAVTTELGLKPFVAAHVPAAYQYAFPSGHTTGAFALALTTAVLLLPDVGTSALPGLARVALGAGALAVAAGTAVAVVGLGWHHVTDAIGGAAAAAAVVLAVAAVVGAAASLSRLPARPRPHR